MNRRDLRVSFLVSMREDSIAKLDFFKGRIPNLFDNYLRIDHLDSRQARDAIVQAGRAVQSDARRQANAAINVEPALVDAVLDQVAAGRVALGGTGKGRVAASDTASSTGERVETPYLQLVMTRLWQEEVDSRLAASCGRRRSNASAAPATSSRRTSTRRSTH